MKKLILSELLLLFLATTFMTDTPNPGWFQQTLPVNDIINDIFFLDSLTGWIVTNGSFANNDTSFILKTSNGGINWTIQKARKEVLNSIQFLDLNTGYAIGGLNGTTYASIYKTTDSGNNWNEINNIYTTQLNDQIFINKDTGWVCSSETLFGGIFKTTNGGLNWQMQLDGSYRSNRIFFLNRDTGWVGSTDAKLYRTTNSGLNWNLQYTTTVVIESVFFLNPFRGWLRGGTGNGVMYTTDGGFNWYNGQGNTAAGFDLRFINDSIGYSGMQSFRIPKSTDGGKTWGYQISPIQNNMSIFMFRNDTLRGWAGGTGIVKTLDGGGNIISAIKSINNKIPLEYKLFQNYPNPFNPVTTIGIDIKKRGYIKIIVYDIIGKGVSILIDKELTSGSYEIQWDGTNYSSGIYFYSLYNDNIIIDTKKMILIK